MSAVLTRSRALRGLRFECIVTRMDSTVRLTPEGYLDEDCRFPEIKLKKGDVIEIDLMGLLGIDTAGVMLWEQFCFLHAGHQFRLVNCPEFFVKHANFFPSFLPKDVQIESFEVKFRCEDCSASARVLFTRDKHYAVWPGGFGRLHHSDQGQVCECGSRVKPKMVEAEAKYMEFLKRTR